jgi:dipeptidyl aminopeptidase/acylaminoacyl peptidase
MLPILRAVFICCFLTVGAVVLPSSQEAASVEIGDRLAYIGGGQLYVGFPHGKLIPGPGTAWQPRFSFDGQWLAFERRPRALEPQLWLARADGSGAHRLRVGGVSEFWWSPTADVLAVEAVVGRRDAPIVLISPDGRAHTLPHRLSGEFRWSPDGRSLAVATGWMGHAVLDVVTGSRVRSYAVPGLRPTDAVELAGWWPGTRGLLYQVDPDASGSIAADGMRLFSLDVRTDRARFLGIALGYDDWIVPQGDRLLVVMGRDRSAFFGKHLMLCAAAGSCRALPGVAAHEVSFAPAWGPNGGSIAFVVTPAWHVWGFQSTARYFAWLGAHVLWIARPDGSGASPAGAEVPHGVEDPEWTRDGRGILFVKNGALWLDSHLGAANPQPIVRFVPPNSTPDWRNPAFQRWYYGHMDWHDLYAWY